MSCKYWISRIYCIAVLGCLGAASGAVAQPGQTESNTALQAKSDADAPVPPGDAKQPIALTVWTLTIKESAGPEAGELESALQDKVNHLPAAVGTQKDVREMIAKLKGAGLVQKSREIRLLALDGQTATVLMGMDQPVIQATNFSEGAGAFNTIMYRAVGTVLESKPIIDGDGLIQVGLSYESSFLDETQGEVIAVPPGKEPIRAPAIVRKNTTTLVRLGSGKAVLVSSDATEDASDEKNQGQLDLLILAAEIVAD